MAQLIASDTNRAITLTQQIADSGEGTVWTTERSNILAKVFKQPTQERTDKLRVMIANRPSDPNAHRAHLSFAWPEVLLTNEFGLVVGFLMPQILGGRELLQIYNPSLRKRRNLEVDWKFLHVTATNIAHIIQAIHERGYVIGDIKPQNILVNNRAMVSIIDTDSFQVRDPLNGEVHRCMVASQGFTPPELLGQDISTTVQNIYHDHFRLGVLIHYLLFGNHPFQGKWTRSGDSPQQEQLIKNRWWPYAPNSPIQPGPSTISLDVVDSQIKQYFLKCFNDGYDNPALRPSADDWYYALRRSVEDLVDCPDVTTHIYRAGYQSCNWCQRKATLGVDIFPGKIKPKPVKIEPPIVNIPTTLPVAKPVLRTISQPPVAVYSNPSPVRQAVYSTTSNTKPQGKGILKRIFNIPKWAIVTGLIASTAFIVVSLPYIRLQSFRECKGCIFYWISLSGHDLHGVDLKGAILNGANLNGANLRGANLHGAILWSTSLQNANLRGADLNADPWGANLSGAYLWGAYITNGQIKSTCNWEKAIYTYANWNSVKSQWEDSIENQQKIDEIRKDTASDPKDTPDCNH